MTKIRPNNGN